MGSEGAKRYAIERNAGMKKRLRLDRTLRDGIHTGEPRLGGGAELRVIDIGSIIHALDWCAGAEKIRVAISYMAASVIDP